MIVNPWLFYVMSVCSAVKVFSIVMSFAAGIIFCVLGCFCIIVMINDEEVGETIQSAMKWTLFLFFLCSLMYILIPDNDTLLLMQAAKLATTDNVNSVFEALKGAIDYAVSVVK